MTDLIQFGDCEIDVAGFALRRGGAPCEIEPQVLELLLFLARNPDRLITKDDLIQHVWHGRIVSDTTVTSRIKSARKAIGDDGTQQKFIRTVHGRGVRFIGAVKIGASDGAAPAAAAAPAAQPWPAIAVLPFANRSDDPEQDYFADGFTEDIITDLSRFRELRVIARDSCFRFRSASDDLQRVGRALAADYVATGSIRRRGSKLRLTAQLTSIESGSQLWAERFDRDAEDVFIVADELVRIIVGTLVGRVRSTGSALAKRKAPANLAAYECVLRGQAAQALIGDAGQEAAARRFFAQALASDPDYPRAHAGFAVALLCEWFRAPENSQMTLDCALEHAEKAVAIDDADYECHETLGWILLHCKSYDLSEQHYRRAIELNPNSPAELAAMGSACSFLGRPDEGIEWFELARRIDPFFDATWYWNLLGAAFFNARRYDDAVAAFERTLGPPLWVKAYEAAARALAGRADIAQDLAASVMKAAPDFCAVSMVHKEPYKNPADLDHLVAGLQAAGLLSAGAISPTVGAEPHGPHPMGFSSFVNTAVR
jgi:adenylate cyclase